MLHQKLYDGINTFLIPSHKGLLLPILPSSIDYYNGISYDRTLSSSILDITLCQSACNAERDNGNPNSVQTSISATQRLLGYQY